MGCWTDLFVRLRRFNSIGTTLKLDQIFEAKEQTPAATTQLVPNSPAENPVRGEK